jgi:hypothetical protein
VPDTEPFENGFKVQWEEFIRHLVEDAPFPYDLLSGARGVLMAEKGLESSRTGARVDIPAVTAESVREAAAELEGAAQR